MARLTPAIAVLCSTLIKRLLLKRILSYGAPPLSVCGAFFFNWYLGKDHGGENKDTTDDFPAGHGFMEEDNTA